MLLISPVAADQQLAPTFRTATELVRLDVVVRDHDDRPVRDLTAADFEIRDSGRPQRIETFEHMLAPAVRRDLTAAGDRPSVDVATNQPASGTRAVVAVVVDDGSLEPIQVVPTQRVLREVLSRFDDNDLVSLTLVGRSDLGRDFTTDAPSLIAAVGRLSESLGSASTIAMTGGVRSTFDRDVHIVLNNVIKTLTAAREARRLIIYVSRGTMEGRSPGRLGYSVWNTMFEAARRAGIRVYAIDPGGLLAPELGLEATYEQQTPEMRSIFTNARKSGQRFLQELAGNTEGLAFVDRWDLSASVDELVADTSSYYLIGYRPDPPTTGRLVRKVDIKVRGSGLRASARSSYLAQGPVGGKEPESALRDALVAGLPGGALALTAFATPIGRVADGVRYLAGIDVPALSAPDELRLSWIGVDGDGKIARSGEKRLVLTGTGGGRATSVLMPLDLPQRVTVVRLAISSPGTGPGVVHLQVADHQRDMYQDGWRILPPLVSVAEPSSRPLTVEPLPLPDGFFPTTERSFGSTSTIHVLTRLMGVLPPIATLEAVVTGPGGERRAVLQPATGLTANDIGGSISLSGLQPGAYALELRATTMSGERRARSVAIQVR